MTGRGHEAGGAHDRGPVHPEKGFELVESSACVDPRNYSEEIGQEACMEKIRDRIWNLLGFLLQTAWMGVRKDESTKG